MGRTAKYGDDCGSHTGYRRKSVMFFVCFFLFVMLWNDKVCDNRNTMKRCNFQNVVSLHRGSFVVVHHL